MKKVLLLIFTVFMLLAFTSCDGAIDFMGKMGQNIAGTDTKGAQEAANKATVSDDQVTSADEDDRIKKEESKIILDGKEITVSDDLSKVESLLPQIEKDTVDSINKALRNEQSTNVLVEEMKQPVTDTVKTAAQGTATVMNAVLETISGSIPADSDDPAMNAVRDAIDSLSESLTNISNGGEVSKGDVVTLQLIENFATEAAKCMNTEGEVNTDDISSLISEANTLATVTTSLSSASQFTLDLGELISSITGSMGGNEGDTASRSIMILNERQGTNSVIDRIESYDLTDYAATIRSVYASVKTVLGSNTDSSMTTLSLHKSAYEAYANLASSSGNELRSSNFSRFATYDGLMKYVIASVLSEADRYYTLLLTDTSSNWLGRLGLNAEDFPKDIWTVLTDLEDKNEWLLRETSDEVIKFIIPEKYEALILKIADAFGENKNAEVEAVFKDFLQNEERNASTVSCIRTLQFMLEYVSIDGIGDFDINGMLQDALDWLNPNQN